MPIVVPNGIMLSYNGVIFTSLSKSKLSAKPVLDESRRVVLYVEYNLEVMGWIGSTTGCGDMVTDYRKKLTAVAGTLHYVGIGAGSIIVNAVGPPFDAAWGPIPELLDLVPLGGGNACIVTWRVVFRVPECDGATRYEGLITVNYDVDIDIDQDGYSTRTINGHHICAQTRQPFNNKVKTNADAFREQIEPPHLLGFQRITRTFKLSKDRLRADWVFTDKELVVPLPDGQTTIQLEQTVRSQLKNGGDLAPKGFIAWAINFSGSVHTPAGHRKDEGIAALLSMVHTRILRIQQGVQKAKGNPIIEFLRRFAGTAGKVIPMSMSIGEQVLGREARLEASFLLIATRKLDDVIKATAMFTPLDGTHHQQWHNSLGLANDVRGFAQLSIPGGDEALIDLCTTGKPTTLKPGIGKKQAANFGQQAELKGGRSASFKAAGGGPPEEESWLSYEAAVRVVDRNRVVRHKKLPVEDPGRYILQAGIASPLGTVASFARQDGDRIVEKRASTDDVIQSLGSPSYAIVLSGQARRWGHMVSIPRLVAINGVPVTQVDSDVQHMVDGGVLGLPVHWATWRITYLLPRKFEGPVPHLANPVLLTDGGSNRTERNSKAFLTAT